MKSPYKAGELERYFKLELDHLQQLLAPALTDYPGCQRQFITEGFRAEEPQLRFMRSISDEYGQECLLKFTKGDPRLTEQVAISDLVKLSLGGAPQRIGPIPSPWLGYWGCISDVARAKKTQDERSRVVSDCWSVFANAANAQPDENVSSSSSSRGEKIRSTMTSSFRNAGFDVVSLSKKLNWHPHRQEIDAAIVIYQDSTLRIVVTSESDPARRVLGMTHSAREPDKVGHFDDAMLTYWALPTRPTPKFPNAALQVWGVLARIYTKFHSYRGLKHLMDAHAAQASIIFDKAMLSRQA